MQIPINRIIISQNNPRQFFDEESLRKLGENIKTHGLIQPIVVRPLENDYELVVGERRLRACVLVGIEKIEAEVRELDDASAYELRLIENVHREDLSDAEKGDAVYQLWSMDKYETIKDLCEALQLSYDTVAKNWLPKARGLSPKVKEFVNSRTIFREEHARALMKYSHSIQDRLADVIVRKKIPTTVIRDFIKLFDENPDADLDSLADKVMEVEKVQVPKTLLTPKQKKKLTEEKAKAKAEKSRKSRTKPNKPKTKEQIKGEKRSAKPFRYRKIIIKEKKSKVESPLLPEGQFNVILADPPWAYDFSLSSRGDPEVHYPTLSIDELSKLKVNGIPITDKFAEESILFLWTTNPKLEEALEVMRAWGFQYKTNMVWVKDKIGTGYYVRGQHELLLIGTKASMPIPLEADRPSSVLIAKRTEHSEKPIEVNEIIERMYPKHKYLELFATKKKEGWITWGNSILGKET